MVAHYSVIGVYYGKNQYWFIAFGQSQEEYTRFHRHGGNILYQYQWRSTLCQCKCVSMGNPLYFLEKYTPPRNIWRKKSLCYAMNVQIKPQSCLADQISMLCD